MPTASDGATFSNISATTAQFKLGGGRYNVMAAASAFGSGVVLQALAPDGATWVPVFAPNLTANGFQTVDVGPGQYRFNVGATAAYVSVWRVPS